MELFAKPIYLLYFLPVLAALLLVWWSGARLKRNIICALFGPAAYQKLTARTASNGPLRNLFFLAGVFFLFAALARPQWGTEIVQAKGNYAQSVIAVDLSDSMKARDLAPDRLTNAKNMLTLLVSHLRDERIGVLAFTSKAFIQCPITTDEAALKYFISSLRAGMLPVAGTSLAEPVKLAAQMLGKYPGQKALILLTDGEDHSPQELAAAKELANKNGIRVIAIGIGTKEGALIPDKVDAAGRPLDYKKDRNGQTVISRLDEKSLAELAQATNGVYIQYTSPAQVAAKVEEAVKNLDRSESAVASRAGYKNRYAVALSLALACLGVWLLLPRRKLRAEAASSGVKKVE